MKKVITISGLKPAFDGYNSQCFSIILYNWDKAIAADWLDFIETLFASFDRSAIQATANREKEKTHGNYRRVKKRLLGFLSDIQPDTCLDVRIRSEAGAFSNEAFFPAELEVVFAQSVNGAKRASIHIRDHVIESLDAFVEHLEYPLMELCGSFYGGAWKFPAAYGPASYLACVGTVQKGQHLNINADYTRRLTCFRKNIQGRDISLRQGYFREIYPVNYLSEAHLDNSFQNKPLSDYINKYGVLTEVDISKNMFKWELSEDVIERVRLKLEDSGLVLSSNTDPKRYPEI